MKKNILLVSVLMALVSLCLVFASCDNGSSDSSVPTPVPVTGITLDNTELIIIVGAPDVKLIATVAPDNAMNKNVTWSSDKADVATVDAEGNVHAVTPGTANITVTTTDGGKIAICKVTVLDVPAVTVESVSLDKTELTLTVGDADMKLTATVAPENASYKIVRWSSDKAEVATVDTEGNVHAVAAGSATITVTTTDGGKTATCKVNVLPAGALNGLFSVSEDKKVYFAKGNLWYDGSAFKFEDNQYSFEDSWDTSHVSHFYWSKNASVAYAASWSESGTTTDVFFTNETTETANPNFKVNGETTNKWRTLSEKEWTYLFDTYSRMVNGKPCYSNAVSGVTIEGTTYKGLFLYPDDYNGNVVSSDSMTWNQINAAGVVFLPAAGGRDGSGVSKVGSEGNYCSSTPKEDISVNAYRLHFLIDSSGSGVVPAYSGVRGYGYSVRLVVAGN